MICWRGIMQALVNPWAKMIDTVSHDNTLSELKTGQNINGTLLV